MWNILEENYYTHSTLWIFSKSSCNYVLVSRALINFITEVIPQTAMLRNSSEDRSSTEAEYVMQLLEASLVHRGFQTLSTLCSYSKLAQFTGVSNPEYVMQLLDPEYVMQLLEASTVHRGFQTLSTSCSYSKLAQFTGMKLLTIIAATWDDRDKEVLSRFTIPAQKLHQHLMSQKKLFWKK